MCIPIIIQQESFQSAWIEAVTLLHEKRWELWNLIVHIQNPCALDTGLNQRLFDFTSDNNILSPKKVAYTIFPQKLYDYYGSADELFVAYNREKGFFERLKRRYRINWGTYFRRMTYYERDNTVINQLKTVIDKVNANDKVYKARYTVLIQHPNGETSRPLGGPCLNFIAVQMKNTLPQKSLSLLCIYRNHDFFKRAYGNYWGLCNLLNFLAIETNSVAGPLTCISSHAYVNGGKTALKKFINES